jgi:hypothetical protein
LRPLTDSDDVSPNRGRLHRSPGRPGPGVGIRPRNLNHHGIIIAGVTGKLNSVPDMAGFCHGASKSESVLLSVHRVPDRRPPGRRSQSPGGRVRSQYADSESESVTVQVSLSNLTTRRRARLFKFAGLTTPAITTTYQARADASLESRRAPASCPRYGPYQNVRNNSDHH